jgi:hypothetical protein
MNRRHILWALPATLAALAFQLFMVYGPYRGNWTGLYCFGSNFPVPAALANLNIRTVPGAQGYDGQFYFYIAQDPFLNRGYAQSLDQPRFRYRRILVPLAAHALAAGRPHAIAISFAVVTLFSVFIGSYWLARFASVVGRHPAWGCAFLFVPGVLISVDRQTVDAALAACCVGFALYLVEDRPRALFGVLVAAALTRETGILLIAAAAGTAFLDRRFARSFALAAAALPAFAWYAYVHAHTPPVVAPLFDPVPLRALMTYLISPLPYADFGALAWIPRSLDRLGLLGMLAAIALSFRQLPGSFRDPVRLAVLLFALLAIWHSAPGTWSDVYGYARSFAPLFLLAALDGLQWKTPARVITALLPLPRVALQLAGQILSGLRSLS